VLEEPGPTSDESAGSGASLRISVAPSIADAALIPAWLEEHNPGIGHALARPGHEQWIAVEIDGTTYDYRVTVTAMRDGEPLVPPSDPITCECNSESLLVLLDQEISAAVYRLRAIPVAVVAAREPEPTPPAPTLTSAKGSQSLDAASSRRWSISRLGIAGGATGAFGVLAVGVGIAFAIVEPREIDGWSRFERDFAPLGYALVSVGSAALTGGVAMIVADATRPRGRSRHARTNARRALVVGPVFAERTLGVTLGRRF